MASLGVGEMAHPLRALAAPEENSEFGFQDP